MRWKTATNRPNRQPRADATHHILCLDLQASRLGRPRVPDRYALDIPIGNALLVLDDRPPPAAIPDDIQAISRQREQQTWLRHGDRYDRCQQADGQDGLRADIPPANQHQPDDGTECPTRTQLTRLRRGWLIDSRTMS